LAGTLVEDEPPQCTDNPQPFAPEPRLGDENSKSAVVKCYFQPLFQKLILSQASCLPSPKTVHIKHPCGAKLGFAQGLINALQIFK